VDGSAGSVAAVGLGAWEAKRRRQPLLLVHGFLDQMPYAAYGWASYQPLVSAVRNDARSMLTDIELRARADHPGLTVRSALVAGGGASTLVELSRTSGLVVVGSRGLGGFAGLLLGSVGGQVAMHGHAPVIVVRPPDAPTPVGRSATVSGPVVVGVDGPTASAATLGFAFDEASARGVPLVALYVWWLLPLDNLGPTSPVRYDPVEAQVEADRMLAEALAGWSEKYPDVPVRPVAQHDMNPSWALIEASRAAGLVVVGSRGRGGFASLLLGSVSQALVGNGHCPVAVIRESY
jgi:nucleotide-binding universal stress UspA family protein